MCGLTLDRKIDILENSINKKLDLRSDLIKFIKFLEKNFINCFTSEYYQELVRKESQLSFEISSIKQVLRSTKSRLLKALKAKKDLKCH